MKIVFPHIPKCAGSSVKKQLSTRDDVYFDYFNHPTWVFEPDRAVGRLEQNRLMNLLTQMNAWIVFGHFASCVYNNLPYDIQIVLLRDPLDRAVSHFYYVKQLLPDNEITRRRHREVGLIKENRMTIEEFAELDHIRYFYSEYYLRDIILDDRLIVLPVENLNISFQIIMEYTGIHLDNFVWVNKSEYTGSFDHLRKWFSTDTALYHDLINRPIRAS